MALLDLLRIRFNDNKIIIKRIYYSYISRLLKYLTLLNNRSFLIRFNKDR